MVVIVVAPHPLSKRLDGVRLSSVDTWPGWPARNVLMRSFSCPYPSSFTLFSLPSRLPSDSGTSLCYQLDLRCSPSPSSFPPRSFSRSSPVVKWKPRAQFSNQLFRFEFLSHELVAIRSEFFVIGSMPFFVLTIFPNFNSVESFLLNF